MTMLNQPKQQTDLRRDRALLAVAALIMLLAALSICALASLILGQVTPRDRVGSDALLQSFADYRPWEASAPFGIGQQAVEDQIRDRERLESPPPADDLAVLPVSSQPISLVEIPAAPESPPAAATANPPRPANPTPAPAAGGLPPNQGGATATPESGIPAPAANPTPAPSPTDLPTAPPAPTEP
ncbi:MAG TPA: hypothetical protein VGE07_22595, partial [Herpetosiphonaceae bacterium]